MLPRTTVAFDLSRCVIGPRYKLIYNVLTTLPYAPVDMSGNPFWQELAVLNNSGKLNSAFRRLFFARPRPMFELFDLARDPFELNNLYGNDPVAGPQPQLREKRNRGMRSEARS